MKSSELPTPESDGYREESAGRRFRSIAQMKQDPRFQGGRVDVSIILPIHNENGHIEQEVERIRTAMTPPRTPTRSIAVDDASTDGSTELLREMDDISLVGASHQSRLGTRTARGKHLGRGRVSWSGRTST